MNATNNDLKDHVEHIADMLSHPDKFEAMQKENYGDDYDENDHGSAFAWLEDVLDIEYIVSSSKEYLGARVLVTFGGPNIWVNTRTNMVEGYWWGDEAHARFDDNLRINDTLEELYNC